MKRRDEAHVKEVFMAHSRNLSGRFSPVRPCSCSEPLIHGKEYLRSALELLKVSVRNEHEFEEVFREVSFKSQYVPSPSSSPSPSSRFCSFHPPPGLPPSLCLSLALPLPRPLPSPSHPVYLPPPISPSPSYSSLPLSISRRAVHTSWASPLASLAPSLFLTSSLSSALPPSFSPSLPPFYMPILSLHCPSFESSLLHSHPRRLPE